MDCQFYFPKHRELERRLHASRYSVHRVGERAISTQVVDGPFGSDLKVEEYVEKGVPLIRVSNCRTGEIVADEELVFVSEKKHQQLKRSEVLPGDVLLTKAGHILGYTAVFPRELGKGNITSHLASIRPATGVEPQFLATYLASTIGISQIYRWGNKATRPELNTDEVRSLLVVLPPPHVQRQLVGEMQAAREARKQKLREADELLAGLDAYLLDTLNLPLPSVEFPTAFAVRLREINRRRFDTFFYRPDLRKTEELVRQFKPMTTMGSLLSRPPMNGIDARAFVDAGQKYLRVQNIRPYELSLDDVKRVAIGFSKDISLKAGDVLLTRKGTFGVAALVPANAEDYVISSEIILLRLRTDSDCLPEYLIAWLNSSVAEAIFDRHKTGGIMGHLTQEVVSDFPVPLPAPQIQEAIAAEVRRRRTQARRLRGEADADWAAAKRRFEEQLLTRDSQPIRAKNKSARARLTQ